MPVTTVVHRNETFRDMYNISKPLLPHDAANADPLDVKLVQFLLRHWAVSGGSDAVEESSVRREAAKVTMREGFINGQFDLRTQRAVQLFETEFCLPGDGVITPLPMGAISSWMEQRSPIEFLRHKLGMLDCNFLYHVNKRAGRRTFAAIRRDLAREMPADLAASLYPELKPRRELPVSSPTATM